MAEDLGGSPFSGGADHGDADDEFATVVFDEAFVRSAAVHEPSARERQLAAAEARFEPDPAAFGRGYESCETVTGDGLPLELRPHPPGLDDDRHYPDPWSARGRVTRGRRRASRFGRPGFDPRWHGHGRYVAQQRWHRPVAWVLAVVMGLGVVAVAVAAIYRGAGGGAGAPAPRPQMGTSSPSTGPAQSGDIRPARLEPAVPSSGQG